MLFASIPSVIFLYNCLNLLPVSENACAMQQTRIQEWLTYIGLITPYDVRELSQQCQQAIAWTSVDF